MCSCGKMKTNLLSILRPGGYGGPGSSRPVAAAGSHGAVQFEYVGRSAITAIGPVTGRRYAFSTPGAQIAVDPRDRHALAQVPTLRQLR